MQTPPRVWGPFDLPETHFMVRRVASLALLIGTWMASDASAQVKLEYKFPEGSSTNVKSTLKFRQTLSIGDMNIETQVDVESNASQSVGKRAADGVIPLTQKAASIKVHVEAGGQTFDIDSADPKAKFDIPALESAAKQLNAITTSEYKLLLNDKNEFKSVEGVDSIFDKVKDDEKAVSELKKRLSPEVLKREFEQDHNNLPKVLATKGDTWETTEVDSIGGGQTLTFRRRYEYIGTKEKDGRTLDEIGVRALDVTYASDPDAEAQLTVVKSDLKIDSSKGTILFDREAGMVVERGTEDVIKGEMTIKVNGMELPSKLALTVEQKVNNEAVKKDK